MAPRNQRHLCCRTGRILQQTQVHPAGDCWQGSLETAEILLPLIDDYPGISLSCWRLSPSLARRSLVWWRSRNHRWPHTTPTVLSLSAAALVSIVLREATAIRPSSRYPSDVPTPRLVPPARK